MTLAAGTMLGPYEILGSIGAGGMGQVYRARDTRLGRTVAIKVSLECFSERFEQEARAVSALNHPNICTLYDVGTDYLVMEFVDGRPLQGPLPGDQALRYATQIAAALDAAHRQGIVHRDLKPTNILVTKEGVKLLDFGLAKQLNPTQQETLTAAGAVLGTPAYMAPEQWEGTQVGPEADIYAFGAVLYELLTGERVHRSASLQTLRPAMLDRLVKTCLARQAEERWQSARDLKHALEAIGASGTEESRPAPPRRLPWFVAAAAGVVALALGIGRWQQASPAASSYQLHILPLPGTTAIEQVSISRDGSLLALVAGGRLWIRPMDSAASRPLAGAEGARYPFWSPDGASIGFFADGKLKKIAVSGGPPVSLADAPDGRGGSWSQDGPGGTILFAPAPITGLSAVSGQGGPARKVTDVGSQLEGHRFPVFLPEGRRFLYLDRSVARGGIYIASLDSPGGRRLVEGIVSPAFGQTRKDENGYLLYVKDGMLLAQSLDSAGNLTGGPAPVVEDVNANSSMFGNFSASMTGTLVFGGVRYTRLEWFGRDGTALGAVGANIRTPTLDLALSPDETRVALQQADRQGSSDLWVLDLARATTARLTTHPGHDGLPAWGPGSDRLAFHSTREGLENLFLTSASGSGKEQPLLRSPIAKYAQDWSRDGRFILFSAVGLRTKQDLWVLPLSRDFTPGEPTVFLSTEFNERNAKFSPDGKWVAYASDETGQDEVYVQSFPTGRGKHRISAAGGNSPLWQSGGKELYYLAPDGGLFAVPVRLTSTFQGGKPIPLFNTAITGVLFGHPYGVSANGQRFLLNKPVDSFGGVTVWGNWSPRKR